MKLKFPDGKRFAFTIIDDTDVATLANVKPVYDLLHDCGLRTTKTVWPFRWPGEGSSFVDSDTLEDPAYLAFVQDLARQGFEIASHGATMESSERSITEAALQRFTECFGSIPAVYANHSYNAEGIYWGVDRFDDPVLRLLARRMQKTADGYFQGHVPGSPYWWGDLCLQHHRHVRNLTCTGLNTLHYNPSMPYHDPKRPWVNNWFSATDAEDCEAFVRLMTPQNLDRLEAQGGVCIIATHLGKNFTRDGVVDPRVKRALHDVGRRQGLFIPVGPLLDWLQEQRGGDSHLPTWEWRAMQWRWAADLLLRKLARRRSH
jgi:hypothetical protein